MHGGVQVKAISVWEPWASLIAMELKRFETRSWSTNYRGPLLICASKFRLTRSQTLEILPGIREAIRPHEFARFSYNRLPFGKALCVVDLEQCFCADKVLWQLGLKATDRNREIVLGDYTFGRFAWKLTNVRRFKEPWPWPGSLGLFNVPDKEIAKHEFA